MWIPYRDVCRIPPVYGEIPDVDGGRLEMGIPFERSGQYFQFFAMFRISFCGERRRVVPSQASALLFRECNTKVHEHRWGNTFLGMASVVL